MKNLEQAAREYAKDAYYPAPDYGWYDSDHEAMQEVLEQAYLTGANFALSHQWRRPEDELPEDDTVVLIKTDVRIEGAPSCTTAYCKNTVWHFTDDWFIGCTVICWMSIPEFQTEQK